MNNYSVRHLARDFGTEHDGHAHWADHVSVIIKGPVRIDWQDPDGTTGQEVADRGDVVYIPAPRKHKFTPLHERGCEWRCIFNYTDAMAQGAPDDQWDKDK